jgi:hypothetical protein
LRDKRLDPAPGGLGMQGFAAGLDTPADHLRIVAEQQQAAAQQRQRRLAAFAQVALEPPGEGDQAVVPHADGGGEQAALAERAGDLVGEDALGNDQGDPAVVTGR